MLKIVCTFSLSIIMVFISVANALAGNFTAQDVQNVINALQNIDDQKIPKSLVAWDNFGKGDYESVMDEEGNLRVYEMMFNKSLLVRNEYIHLQNVAKTSGFTTVSNWAKVSDDVLKTYMLTQIERSDLELLVSLSPEQMRLFPESDLADIISLRKLGAKLLLVPKDDIDTFSVYANQYAKALE